MKLTIFFFIASPYVSVGPSGRNDPDNFDRVAIYVGLSCRMCDDQQRKAIHQAKGLPSTLSVFHAIVYRDM